MLGKFAMCLVACTVASQGLHAAPTPKKGGPAKALPVFSFMDQTTDKPRTMTALGDGGCSQRGATTSCMQIGGELAGRPLIYLSISFHNDRLYEVSGSAKKWAHPDILAAFTAKYGKPLTRSQKWQNKMGASFENSVAVWKFKGGALELRAIGSRIDDMDFAFIHLGNSPPATAAKVDF